MRPCRPDRRAIRAARDENTDADADCDDETDERLYYLNDANFNVTALVNTSGAVVERYRYRYSPAGEVTVLNGGAADTDGNEWTVENPDDQGTDGDGKSDVNNAYLYTGRRYDPETGLYYYRARYYHAQLGRFVGHDPTRYSDGASLYTAYFAMHMDGYRLHA